MKALDDPFFIDRLNPLLLDSLRKLGSCLNEPLIQKTVLRYLFCRLFKPLYGQAPLKMLAKVYVLGCVHPDGLGDYYALLKTAKTLQQTFDISLAFIHQTPLPAITTEDYNLKEGGYHPILEKSNIPILEPILEGQIPPFQKRIEELQRHIDELTEDFKLCASPVVAELLAEEKALIAHLEQYMPLKQKAYKIYEQLKSCQAIVHIALALNTFDNPDFASKSLYFSESGNFTSMSESLRRHWFSMGLGSFEEGIFLEVKPQAMPVQKPFYMSYLPRSSYLRVVFIYLTALLQQNDPQSYEIWTTRFNPEEISEIDFAWLKKRGVDTVAVDECGPEGKTIHVRRILPLPQTEFEMSVSSSGMVVGCTGDGSLTNAIASGKIPFYETRTHKIETLQSLIQISRLLQLKHIETYFNLFQNNMDPISTAEAMHRVIKHDDFQEQWSCLLRFVHTHYCLEDSLVSHVKRILLKPDLGVKEESLILKYEEGKMLAREAYECFQDFLSL